MQIEVCGRTRGNQRNYNLDTCHLLFCFLSLHYLSIVFSDVSCLQLLILIYTFKPAIKPKKSIRIYYRIKVVVVVEEMDLSQTKLLFTLTCAYDSNLNPIIAIIQ